MTPERRLIDYLRADDERPFLERAFADALTDEDRLRYADLLEVRDPERAEWLRIEVALHARAAEDPAVVARFVELAPRVGLDFANALFREVILNCGFEDARREGPRVRFAYRCPKRWETLAPADAGESAAVRHCQRCDEPVHYCDTVAAATERALAGQCIAIPRHLSDGGVETLALGRPDPVAMWADRLFPLGRPRRG